MKIRKIVSSVVMWGVMLSIFFLNIPAMAQNKVSGTSSISGVFFEDTNINGKKDINEKGLSGISIKLTDENGTEIPGKEVTTRADGKYIFEGLEGRNYALKIEVPKGYRVVTSRYFQMDKNGQTGFVSLEENDQFEDGWLGFYKTGGTSSISGVFFEDTNINGKQDINEKGLSGISIKLTDENGTEIPGKEVTTRADGKYIFEGLEGRNYALKIEVPKGYRVVTSRYFQMDKNGQTGFVSLEEDDQFEDGWLGFYKER